MPILFAAVIIICIVVIVTEEKNIGYTEVMRPSPIAGNWALAACLYISYNILAMIPIVATSSLHAESKKTAIAGSGLGGIFLGILAFFIVIALQKDMPFAQEMDMPMLAYSSRISKTIGLLYGLILFAAIYSSASSNFYGFTTKIKSGPHKKTIVIVSAMVAFLLGLLGFKKIVAYMFPIEGYLGFAIILMLCINFIKVIRSEVNRKNYSKEMRIVSGETVFQDFAGNNRLEFPSPIVRVTGGDGGEALLILGTEKTALYDCGMACFSQNLIYNIKSVLFKENRTLDYVFLSHTHYDHIGALPYVLNQWENAVVCGSEKAKSVFESTGALKTIEELGNKAKKIYGCDDIEITSKGMRVDVVLRDGDCISLGTEKIIAFETKGHTDCSMSYLLTPQGIMFASESTGVQVADKRVDPSPLKSFDETIQVAQRLKQIPFNYLIVPHFGLVPEYMNTEFFDNYIKAAQKEKNLINNWIRQGLSEEEILKKHIEVYRSDGCNNAHPYEAYELNTRIIINNLIKNMYQK